MRKLLGVSTVLVIVLLFITPLIVRAEQQELSAEQQTATREMKKAAADASKSATTAEKQAMIAQQKAQKQALLGQMKQTERDAKAGTREATREDFKETKDAESASREAMKEQVTENRKENLQMRFTWRVRYLEAAISRLEDIIGRFESRIAKIGITRDTTKAKAGVAEAKTQLISAKTTLEELKTAIDAVLASATPKETYAAEIKPLVDKLHTYLTAAHQALTMGIGSIKNTVSPTPSL